jgi:outer membrane translocation and assembly module TamA
MDKFSNLTIGEKFHTGKDGESFEVFVKVSKSKAERVEAHGKFNRIGGLFAFSAMSPVWIVK